MSNRAQFHLTELYQHRELLENLVALMDTDFIGLYLDIPKLSKTEKNALAQNMYDLLYGLDEIGAKIKESVSEMDELVFKEARLLRRRRDD